MLEERLNKIRKATEEIHKDMKLMEKGLSVVKQTYTEHINSYKERIKNILIVGNALINSDIEISCNFQPNSKELGFIIENNLWGKNRVVGLGYYGQNLETLLLVNEKGEVTYSPNMIRYSRYKWTKDFEKFEKKLYEYIDNEI